MRLSKQDIQEAKDALDAGQSLSDGYRFLLFKDKNEVELIWNGTIHFKEVSIGRH